eukprot:764706-Hanusia_phi.AAC.5
MPDGQVLFLIEDYGATVDVQDTEGYTPLLRWALMAKQVKDDDLTVAQILIKFGAMPMVTTRRKRNGFDLAFFNDGKEVMELLRLGMVYHFNNDNKVSTWKHYRHVPQGTDHPCSQTARAEASGNTKISKETAPSRETTPRLQEAPVSFRECFRGDSTGDRDFDAEVQDDTYKSPLHSTATKPAIPTELPASVQHCNSASSNETVRSRPVGWSVTEPRIANELAKRSLKRAGRPFRGSRAEV